MKIEKKCINCISWKPLHYVTMGKEYKTTEAGTCKRHIRLGILTNERKGCNYILYEKH